MCAVTLLGPNGPGCRVIGIYAPATHRQGRKAEKALYQALYSELNTSRRKGIRPIIIGDFNDTPVGDRTFQDVPSPYPKSHSLVRLLTQSSFLDGFRTQHPDVHGATFCRQGCRPSRIDSGWFPRAWGNVLGTEAFTASVDAAAVNMEL